VFGGQVVTEVFIVMGTVMTLVIWSAIRTFGQVFLRPMILIL